MPVKTVGVALLGEMIRRGAAPRMIDVRTAAEFAGVHATGAELIPLDRLDPATVAASRGNPDDPLYLICQSGGRSSKACEKLEAAGIAGVYSVEGGTVAWVRAGLPVERGERRVISLERQVRIAAGSLVLTGLALAWAVHPYFLALTGFVGAGLVFAGLTDFCGMAILLGKMPWNRNRCGDSIESRG